MNKTDMESLVKQLKAAGLNDEQIMETFYETFKDGKMDRADLEACAEFMGYELTDEFKNDATPDPMSGGNGEGAGEGVTKEEAEAAKEIKPGESKEEFQETVEGQAPANDTPPSNDTPPTTETPSPEGAPKAEEKPEGTEEASKSEPENDEDKEWEEVQKKFKW